jgi:hypothetical protein
MCVTALTLSGGAIGRPPGRRNPIQKENAKVGVTDWLVGDVANRSVEGYASEISVVPGDSVHLHVSTAPAALYRVAVYRIGWYGGRGARLVACIPNDCAGFEQGAPQPIPGPDPATGVVRAHWPVTDTIEIGTNWTSGYYLARLVPANGTPATAVLFVVREQARHASRILIDVPVNTWQAYNAWGGRSLYVATDGGVQANHISFDRPWGPGSELQFLGWGLSLVRFLEREGYDVSYTTDADIDRDPAELLHHALVIVNGHGEYWTSGMRDAFEAAREAGVNLMFMGANIGYWQIRYEDDRRTIVAYKSTTDPVTDPKLQSVLFRSLVPERYECALLGVAFQGATEPGGGTHDYSVNGAAIGDRWFAGTGFTTASVLPQLVGPEWDQVIDPKKAWSCDFADDELTVFFHYDGKPGNADAVRYVWPSGSIVFSAGSLQFVWGLDTFLMSRFGYSQPTPDARLQQFVRNALQEMTRRRPGGWLPGPWWRP